MDSEPSHFYMKKGLIFVISGPSGSGKTTLAKKILRDSVLRPKLARLVSFTTRPKRRGERDKQDYCFISKAEFLKLRKRKKFLEWTRYLGYYYATAKNELKNKLSAGKSVVLCIDQKGAFNVRRFFGAQARLIFILPPDLATLKQRIELRAGHVLHEHGQEISRRLGLAKDEIKQAHKYDYCFVNKSLNKALKVLKDIIRKETA